MAMWQHTFGVYVWRSVWRLSIVKPDRLLLCRGVPMYCKNFIKTKKYFASKAQSFRVLMRVVHKVSSLL